MASKFAVRQWRVLEVRGLREDMDAVMAEGNQMLGKKHELDAKAKQVSPGFIRRVEFIRGDEGQGLLFRSSIMTSARARLVCESVVHLLLVVDCLCRRTI